MQLHTYDSIHCPATIHIWGREYDSDPTTGILGHVHLGEGGGEKLGFVPHTWWCVGVVWGMVADCPLEIVS